METIRPAGPGGGAAAAAPTGGAKVAGQVHAVTEQGWHEGGVGRELIEGGSAARATLQEDARLQMPVMPMPPLGQPTPSQEALMTPYHSQEAAAAPGSDPVPPTAVGAKPPSTRAGETGPPAANTRAAEKALADKP